FGLTILNEAAIQKPTNSSDGAVVPPVIDIIFVHGLGGSAKGTWTHPQSKWFGPPGFAAMEGFENVRVSTFGYDSRWDNVLGTRNVLDIGDFSSQLLMKLDAHYDRKGDVRYRGALRYANRI